MIVVSILISDSYLQRGTGSTHGIGRNVIGSIEDAQRYVMIAESCALSNLPL